MKEYRQQKGLSQLELSQLIGVSRRTVSDWERGEFFPTEDNLKKLAHVFQIDRKTLRKNLEINFKLKQVKKMVAELKNDFEVSQDDVLALIT